MKTISAIVVASLLCVCSAHADTFGSGTSAFDIEFVSIGNPGNPADTTGKPNPVGSVPYSFRMGKYEISEQMIDKANSLGGLGITMFYRGSNKPATSTSWNEAARFINWLNISSGSTPAYKFSIQPGEVGYHANANIELWTLSDAGYNPDNLYRNSLARYFLPTVDEWYKSAYYDPATSTWYDYPTGSNVPPIPVSNGIAPGTAVYHQEFEAGPADVMNAGGLSPYGTAAQGGNVFEWEESRFQGYELYGLSFYIIRGGTWDIPFTYDMASLALSAGSANLQENWIGFRVASAAVPEPTSLTLLCLGSICLLRRR